MRATYSLLTPLFLLPFTVSAVFNGEISVDDVKFDLKELKGTHQVVIREDTPPTITNHTWIINPVEAIPHDKDVPDSKQCPEGTQICGIEHIYYADPPQDVIHEVIPVAGDDIKGISDSKIDAKYTRLKTLKDSSVEGVRVELHGGEYQTNKTTAFVDFICDREKTGTEDGSDGKENALKFIDWDDKEKILKLEWRTKYACETATEDKPPAETKGSWGFFTWFIVIVFLVVAAYLIFGSWLNYNRYGARGWDLLPHSDTLRDLPYLFRDFARRIVNTFQGSGGRGGYSAV